MRNIIPVDEFTDPVTVLEDGDPVVAGSSEPTAQALTNRTVNLQTQLTTLDANLSADIAALDAIAVKVDGNNTAAIAAGVAASRAALTLTGNNGFQGLDATGQGAAAGVKGTGGATGPGVQGVGGATSGAGVTGTGTAGNAAGVVGSGQGSGAGVTGTGGGTAGAIGVRGTGGASNGIGVRGDGTGTGVGGYFDGAGDGSSASDDAAELAQNLKMSGSNPASTTGFSNRLTKKNIAKAWGLIATNGVGGVSVSDGFNISSVALIGTTAIQVNFATAMASANFASVVSGQGQGIASTFTKTTGGVRINFASDFAGTLYNLSTGTFLFDLVVFAAQ